MVAGVGIGSDPPTDFRDREDTSFMISGVEGTALGTPTVSGDSDEVWRAPDLSKILIGTRLRLADDNDSD